MTPLERLVEWCRQALATVLLFILTLSLMCVKKLPGQEVAFDAQFAAIQSDTTYTLFSQNVLHYWALAYREWRTEFLDCVYGRVNRDSLVVLYTSPADVKPSHSLATGVIPQRTGTCPFTKDSLLGIAHSHPQSCRGGNGAACGLLLNEHGSMHPQDDPGNDPCYESFPDMRTFIQSGLQLNVVVCGVGRIYVQRQGGQPNAQRDVCEYDPEQDVPILRCGKKP